MKTRMALIGIFLLLVIAGLGVWVRHVDSADREQPAEASKPELSLTLDRAAAGVVVVSFHNDKTTPVVFNLGMNLGNGRTLHPCCVGLIITDAAGKSRTVIWGGGSPGVAGRVDDFLVPLMPGASYTMNLAVRDFRGDQGERASIVGPENVKALFRGTSPRTPSGLAIPGLPMVLGQVESTPVTYRE